MTSRIDAHTPPTNSLPPVASASGERERDAELAAFWAECIRLLKAMDAEEARGG